MKQTAEEAMFSAAFERNRRTIDSMEGQEREGYELARRCNVD